MQFQIYADGLGSLVSDEESKEANDSTQEEVEPTAGMSFSLLGVFLREIEFFKGTAGLMSAVWNAPTELTSALQVDNVKDMFLSLYCTTLDIAVVCYLQHSLM